MDDFKLYASNDNDLKYLVQIVKDFSDDIRMEFGLDKCAKATFKAGKFIKSAPPSGTYFGIQEWNGMQHSKIKDKINDKINE